MVRFLAGLSLVLAACGSADVLGDVPDQRFVGRWFVEETVAHALYSASTYGLREDGTIELVWDAGIYGVPHGHVVSPDGGQTCGFGTTWSSVDDRLVIDGVCGDGVARDIVLHFVSDASRNGAGATVDIESVGGEPGWRPPQWGWSFRKCAADEVCQGWN